MYVCMYVCMYVNDYEHKTNVISKCNMQLCTHNAK